IEALLLKGKSYSKLGETSKALAQFDKVIGSQSPKTLAYKLRAEAEYRARDYEKALSDYNLHIKTFPKDCGAYSGRADVHIALNEFQPAMDDYRKCLAIDPKFRPLVLKRIKSILARPDRELSRAGKFQSLVEVYTAALAVVPEELSFYLARAHAYYR